MLTACHNRGATVPFWFEVAGGATKPCVFDGRRGDSQGSGLKGENLEFPVACCVQICNDALYCIYKNWLMTPWQDDWHHWKGRHSLLTGVPFCSKVLHTCCNFSHKQLLCLVVASQKTSREVCTLMNENDDQWKPVDAPDSWIGCLMLG